MNIIASTKRPVHSLLQVVKRVFRVRDLDAHKAARSGVITRRVAHALALTPRGGVKNDVLDLDRLALKVSVEWFARDVHPWDLDLPERRKAELFAQQCLEDVDAAIPRLFKELPEIEVLEIGVLERGSRARIIAGVVRRSDLAAQVGSSLGMRLKTIGIDYRCPDLRLEPIP